VKYVKLLLMVPLAVPLLMATGCQVTYHDPFGGTSVFQWDNDTGDKKEAYEALEGALADNLTAVIDGTISGNMALVALAESNIEEISDAKKKLGYEPPVKVSPRSVVSSQVKTA